MFTIYIHNLQIIHKENNRYAGTDSSLQPKLRTGQVSLFPCFPVFTGIKDMSVLCCLFVLNTDLVFMKHL